ncbi:MAG: CBS domain-containing protein [Proteobacteria bacterium]|nr:CBS domain-containing protein [Pseudomonadota bacterium]
MPHLQLHTVAASSFRIPGTDPWHAKPTDPAITVMTDFRERSSITVPDYHPIDTALEHMKHTGVRCAFAVDADNQVVIGMVTAYDIGGEKPLRLMRSMDVKRSEILVRDLMQPIKEWRVLHIQDLERATVAAVDRLFGESGLTHIPVMEQSPRGEARLRGLFSSAKIKRLLAP